MYTLYLLVYMHRDVIIYAWETGKRSTKHYTTTVTNTQTLHLFLLLMYSYYSTFIVAYTRIARYGVTSQMLFCTLPIASIVSN